MSVAPVGGRCFQCHLYRCCSHAVTYDHCCYAQVCGWKSMPVAGETTHVRQLWLLSMVRLRGKSCPRMAERRPPRRRGQARFTDVVGRFVADASGYTPSAGECGVKDQVSCA